MTGAQRNSRPIFVTGASTGIGRATAVRLAGLGHPVFASARRPEDLEDLGRVGNITPVRLDVRDLDAVRDAVAAVRAAGRGLYALVNNAGVGGIGPIASFEDDEVLDLFEINVFGVFRMTREFLPEILASKGRVILIGSQAGSISMKYFGPYTMTKHALEAFTVALDGNSLELDRERFRRAPPPFDEEARAVLEHLVEDDTTFDPAEPESASNRNPAPAEAVAETILELLDNPDPPLRRLFGTRWEGNRVLSALVQKIADANRCPSLQYTREELLKRLDEALGG
jgi:NAD(P)-dependent dehydrogenase (short-subunit alcohol dehydrogenase family)